MGVVVGSTNASHSILPLTPPMLTYAKQRSRGAELIFDFLEHLLLFHKLWFTIGTLNPIENY